MIKGDEFIYMIDNYFEFLTGELDFRREEVDIRGNVFYNVVFYSDDLKVSVSYENIEDYFLVMIMKLKDGKRPNVDDQNYSKSLNAICSTVYPNLSQDEINDNQFIFKKFEPNTVFERKVLKSAMDLRIVLKNSAYWKSVMSDAP